MFATHLTSEWDNKKPLEIHHLLFVFLRTFLVTAYTSFQHNSIPDSTLSPGSSLWRGQRPETPFSFPELRSFWPAPQIDAVGTSCMGTHIVSERIILKRWRTFSVHVSIASSKHSEELGEFSTVTPETQTRDAAALLSRVLPTEKRPL